MTIFFSKEGRCAAIVCECRSEPPPLPQPPLQLATPPVGSCSPAMRLECGLHRLVVLLTHCRGVVRALASFGIELAYLAIEEDDVYVVAAARAKQIELLRLVVETAPLQAWRGRRCIPCRRHLLCVALPSGARGVESLGRGRHDADRPRR